MKKLSSTTKQNLFNFGVLLAFVVGFSVYLTVSGKWGMVFSEFATMDKKWLLAGLLCMVAYLLLETLSLAISLKLSDITVSFKRLISTTLVGQFFGNITPMQSGAQPAQVASLHAAGISVGASASALLSKFIVYQATLTVYAAYMLFSEYAFFQKAYGNVALLAFLGFTIHVVVLSGLILAALYPRGLRVISNKLITLGSKIKLIKNPAAKKRSVREEIQQFTFASKRLHKHKLELLQISLITVAQLTVFYLVPYCVMRALGVAHTPDPFLAVAAAAFVILIATSVPLPGGSVGAEGSFAVFFGLFIASGDITVVALILWRLITFYLPTLLGAPFVGALKRKQKKARLNSQSNSDVPS